MSSWDVARLNVAVQMHVLKPLDPQAIRIKVRRLTRHKGFSATTLVNLPNFFSADEILIVR